MTNKLEKMIVMKAIMKTDDVIDWIATKVNSIELNKIDSLMYYMYQYVLVYLNKNANHLKYELFPARFYANHYFISKDNNAGRIDYPLIKKFHAYKLMNKVFTKYCKYTDKQLRNMIKNSQPYQNAQHNHRYLSKQDIYNDYLNKINDMNIREITRNDALKHSKVVNIKKSSNIKSNRYYIINGKQLQQYLAIEYTMK